MQAAIDPVSGYPDPLVAGNDTARSAVSWAAIVAGTVVAAAASLLLVGLAAGVGLGSLSPWPYAAVTLNSFTAITAIGLIAVQWLSAGIGGYVTGRLRTRWSGLHTHEVFFRDTAHGLITWASATLLAAGAAAIMSASTTGAAAAAISAASPGAAKTMALAPAVDPYDVDGLLRAGSTETASVPSQSVSEPTRAEVTRLLAEGLVKGGVPAADQAYLKQVVVAQARVSPVEAEARVQAIVAKIGQSHDEALKAAEAARKAAMSASIYTALAMLLGAFIACIAAVLGGHRRDVHA
jgi:hypothetical protein